ncbi:MAG: nucleoside deaminase [Patescibacteria group bacterium]
MNKDKKYLKIAIKQAKLSIKKGGFPAGAVIVLNDKIISKGISVGNIINNPTSHGECSSIRKACKKLKTTNLDGAILYASLQPCIMCLSASFWSGITRIVFAANKTQEMIQKGYYEGNNDIKNINNNNSRKIIIKQIKELEEKSLQLVRKWESKFNDSK